MSINQSSEVKRQSKQLLLAIFYDIFDNTSECQDAVIMMLDLPSKEVGEHLSLVLTTVGIDGRIVEIEKTLKFQYHVKNLTHSQMKVMNYFADKVRNLKEVKYRLPGIHWKAPSSKAEVEMSPRELMFQRTYGSKISPDRIDAVIDEASNYDGDPIPLAVD